MAVFGIDAVEDAVEIAEEDEGFFFVGEDEGSGFEGAGVRLGGGVNFCGGIHLAGVGPAGFAIGEGEGVEGTVGVGDVGGVVADGGGIFDGGALFRKTSRGILPTVGFDSPF